MSKYHLILHLLYSNVYYLMIFRTLSCSSVPNPNCSYQTCIIIFALLFFYILLLSFLNHIVFKWSLHSWNLVMFHFKYYIHSKRFYMRFFSQKGAKNFFSLYLFGLIHHLIFLMNGNFDRNNILVKLILYYVLKHLHQTKAT